MLIQQLLYSNSIKWDEIESNPYAIKFSEPIDTHKPEKQITINRNSNAKLAVIRDSIKLDMKINENTTIRLKNARINDLRSMRDDNHHLLEAIKLGIVKNNIEEYKLFLVDRNNSKSNSILKNELPKLKSSIESTLLAINQAESIISKFSQKPFIEKLKIDEVINDLNSYFNFLNSKLRVLNVGIDLGHIIVFSSLIILFLLLSALINRVILPSIRFSINKITHTEKDLLLEGFNRLKTPILILMVGVGSETALEVILYPNEISENVISGFMFLYIYSFAIFLMKALDIFMILIHNNQLILNQRQEIINTIVRLIKVFIFLVATIFILSNFGVDTNKLITSLGIGSIAIAFALKDTIANIFSGLKLIWDDSFSLGDWRDVRQDVMFQLMDILEKNNLEFAFKTQTVHLVK